MRFLDVQNYMCTGYVDRRALIAPDYYAIIPFQRLLLGREVLHVKSLLPSRF